MLRPQESMRPTGELPDSAPLNLLEVTQNRATVPWSRDLPVPCDTPAHAALLSTGQTEQTGTTNGFRARRKHSESSPHPTERFHPAPAGLGLIAARETYARDGIAAIYLEAAPQKYVVKPAESVKDIAARHLGRAATQDQIEAHEREIRALNGIEANKNAKPGEMLILPGHDLQGNAIFKDTFGTTFSIMPDGRVKCSYKDGTGYIRSYTSKDEKVDEHFGSKPEHNFTVKFKSDGTFERTGGFTPSIKDLHTEKAKLEHLADKHIVRPTERKHFKEAMAAFERRASFQHISKEDIAETYAQISRVLTVDSNDPFERRHVRTAIGIMDAAALPTMSDQGGKNTCNVTTIENRLFTRQPAEAARVVADILTTGKHVAQDGTTVFIDKESLLARGEEALNKPPGTNTRSYASQLFQVAAVNIAHVRNNEDGAPPGENRYEQRASTDNYNDDTGERLFDYRKGSAREKAREPGLSDNEIYDTYNALSGKNEKDFFLDNKNGNGPGASRTNLFSSQKELEDKLKDLKDKGQFPLIIGVYTSNKPFGSDSDAPAKDMLDDGHVVLITDYDEKTHKVAIDNQWGNANDFACTTNGDTRIGVDTLYKSTLHKPANEWLDQTQSRKDKLTHAEYLRRLGTIIGAYEGMWNIQSKADNEYGPLDTADRDRARQRFNTIMLNLPPYDRRVVKRRLEQVKKHFERNS